VPGARGAEANLPAQRIGPNDLISISVYDSPELTRTVRSGPDGYIRLPMLPQPIQAQGRMPDELEASIATALKNAQLIVDPVVTVTVAEYHSRPISVAGAVKQPLTFQADGPVTLLEVLTRAGGLTPQAWGEILVSGPQPETLRHIAVDGLIRAGEPKLNLALSGGEEIRVPEAGKVFIAGNVKKPGVYLLEGASEITVLQALALAEGLAPFARKEAYIYRREGSGARKEIPLPLRAILDRKPADTMLRSDNILYLPDNAGRRATMAALEKILLFGSGAGTAAIYAGVR
jgi:polysaccharide biosynthesis/export protein